MRTELVERTMNGLWRLALVVVCVVLTSVSSRAQDESRYYRLETVVSNRAETASRDPNWRPDRTGVPLEIGGMVPTADGGLMVAIRRGEIWKIHNPRIEAPAVLRMTRFAEGLHEPLGLLPLGDDWLVAQRGEVTRLVDRDGDGEADRYLTWAHGWGVTGNYHEYAYGPQRDGDGRWWITLNVGIGDGAEAHAPYRGWALACDETGAWEPMCTGFRSPSGLGTDAAGRMYVTDQQGDWIGTCSLLHLRPGVFFGHPRGLEANPHPDATWPTVGEVPSGLTWPEAMQRVKRLQPPAVWFPYKKAGQSATDIVCDLSDGEFGPFSGQLFVGEFRLSGVLRVALEEVDGQMQGACFPFRSGFASGVFRLCMTEEGELYAGLTNRGWSSLGDSSYGIQRLEWTGETPFEIHHIEAKPYGFDLVLTDDVDAGSLVDSNAIEVSSYTYRLHRTYGSDEVDGRDCEARFMVDPHDPRRVQLRVDGLRELYVHEIRCRGLRSARGEPLLHPTGFYTLNRIPRTDAPRDTVEPTDREE